MNGFNPNEKLPQLSDQEVRFLDSICKAVPDPEPETSPTNVLHHEYYAQLRERGLDFKQDNTLYSWVYRVGGIVNNSVRAHVQQGTPITGYVPTLRSLLESHNITVVEDSDYGEIEDITRSLEVQPGSAKPNKQAGSKSQRRVSFNDTNLEETWLSERPYFDHDETEQTQHDLLRLPPRRPRDFAPAQRARSVSGSEHHFDARQPATKHLQHPSSSSEYTSDNGFSGDGTLPVDPTDSILDDNADTFRHTTILQVLRACLRIWHEKSLAQQELYREAAQRDYHDLLLSSITAVRRTYEERRQQEAISEHYYATTQQPFDEVRNLQHIFTHWYESVIHNRRSVEMASYLLMARKYFLRWREIAAENATKARSILSRRYIRLWCRRAAVQSLERDRADGYHEAFLMRKYLTRWRRACWNKHVEPWREEKLEKRFLRNWEFKIQERREHDRQAQDFRGRQLLRSNLLKLLRQHQKHGDDKHAATGHFERKLAGQYAATIRIRAKLAPIERTVTLQPKLNLQRRAFRVWHMHLGLSQQASEVDRKRIMQWAWTTWNDALRCKALAQRIDERVVIHTLYQWLIQTRLVKFQRAQEERLLRETARVWTDELRQSRAQLEDASAAFAEGQRWRTLKNAMFRLNKTLRVREEDIRAAVEFSNSRALPDVINVWRERTDHVLQLRKWATDARFFCLTTRSIEVWKGRTTEHQHQRRREAYAQVRARIKLRMARESFVHLRAKVKVLSNLRADAEQLALSRLFRIGTAAFDNLQNYVALSRDLESQAEEADHRKLLTSAISALVNQHADLTAMDQQALILRHDGQLALQASAVRKIQWAAFTAARRVESADALWARNRDLHVKQMLRHWLSHAAARKAAKQDLESPSLRPASRRASKSAERPTFNSSPPTRQLSTPGYTRTPSRSRRSARFRPLPTPAQVTPMAFDRSLFATTPAPLASAQPRREEDNHGEEEKGEDVFDTLRPQITPFARKLRAGGVIPAAPPSALRNSILGRSMAAGGTNKSVRFANPSRFGGGSSRKPNATSADNNDDE